MFPNTTSERNMEVKGKQKSLFAVGPVSKCFVIPPNSKMERKQLAGIISLQRFQGARPDHRASRKFNLLFP